MLLVVRLISPLFFFFFFMYYLFLVVYTARHSRALVSVVINGRTSSIVKAPTLDNAALAFSNSMTF